MAVVRISLKEGMSEDNSHIDSPDLSKAEAEAQAALVAENIISHTFREIDEDTGHETITTVKPDAQGTPGTTLDLGWVSIAAHVVDEVEVID